MKHAYPISLMQLNLRKVEVRMSLVRILLPALLLATFAYSQLIATTGTVQVNAPSLLQYVTIDHIEDGHPLLSINTLSFNSIQFSMKTSITLTIINATHDKLTITATIVNNTAVTYQVGLQYLVLLRQINYEFASFNLTNAVSAVNHTSLNKIVYTVNGTVSAYMFITGFSDPSVGDYVAVAVFPNSIIYQMTIYPTTPNDWLTVTLMIVNNPLLPKCSGSKVFEQLYRNTNWVIPKNNNFVYFYAIQNIYVSFGLPMAATTFLTNNTVSITAGTFSVVSVAVDIDCFKANAIIPGTTSQLETWKIILIAIGGILFIIIVVSVIIWFFMRHREREAAKIAAIEMNPPPLIDYSTPGQASEFGMNAGTGQERLQPDKSDENADKPWLNGGVVPEGKTQWTKEEIDEKFHSV